jgi:ankyrin repeat protein
VAAEKGSLQTIALLVDCGADVNARDKGLNTPIHLVANRVQDDAFQAVGHILEGNPDLSIYNSEGKFTLIIPYSNMRKVCLLRRLHNNVRNKYWE